MKELIILAGVAITTMGAIADGTNAVANAKKVPIKEIVAKMGGLVIDERNMKGQLVIVNAQKEADEATVKESTKKFEKDAKIRIRHERGTFGLKTAKRIGEATVYVISDAELPATMIAADDGWGFVNVAKLRTEKEPFFKSRIRKEVVRVAGFLLGAGDSYLYPLCLTGHVRSMEYLDEVPSEQLPHDVMQRIMKSMNLIGIGPYRKVPYRRACEEGWAAQPTNDVQKAIWDKVHTVPKNPMKIEFDPKKGR